MRRLPVLLVLLVSGGAARAQLYVGPALGPGVGGVGVFASDALGVFTREAAVYADYQPRVLGGRGRLLVAVAAGGGVRVTEALRVVRGGAPGPADLDLGVRVGPAFYYAFFEQTAEAEARAFRIAFDPFARGLLHLPGGRTVFVELGTQQPSLRAGVVF